MKKTLLLLACLSYTSVHAEDNSALIKMLVVAKATGMCGTIGQMTRFQQATQMPGGDEFIVRFLNTEAARLGKPLEQFMKECVSASEMYGQFMKSLEADKGK